MPFFPQVTGDAHGIRQVHTEHSRGRPAVQEPGVRRVAAVRIPDRCEVGRAVIGAVVVILKAKAVLLPLMLRFSSLQKPSYPNSGK